ncbi:Permease of the drug/metabolite transporter (DMT) superfamily [Pedococcus dokdonensis]|uniref:Permease of the drug/metabolite transporter (DMT) superfamily n=1 Tax=Pedococcus dokdonensis TaxID=443156 RepID=A0A1H0PE53_9MICO|nr:DMT family transporter [Pedococcus dokdonensis]SDP03293.1 Permease of the drug/metabolite transporter (DMT) superfamily [Pedococcus dokdonensis]
MNVRTLALFCVVSILWGVPYLLIAEALDAGLGPLTVVAGRVLVGTLVLVAVVRTRALDVLRQAPGKTALLALVEVVVPFTFIAVAERSVTSGTAGVLISLEPFFVLIWSVLLGSGVHHSWARIIPGSVLGFSGVLLLMGTPGGGIGAWLLIAAAGCYALGAVLIDRWFADLPSLSVSAAMLIVATPLTMLVALPIEGSPRWTTGGVTAVVFLGAACTAGGFAAFFALIKNAGAHGASLITYAAPVVALAAGFAIRGEALSMPSVIGTVLILLGAWFCLRQRPARPRTSVSGPAMPASQRTALRARRPVEPS